MSHMDGPGIVIVGAGPAGIGAADVLVRAGLRPVLIDEGRRPGGQGYRKSDPTLGLSLGYARAANYKRIHAVFTALETQIDYRPETLVWSVDGRAAYLAERGAVVDASLSYDRLILATGATDKIAPVPGWTLTGVYTLGGAQVILKDQGCSIGRKVVFYGSSPLLYLAAAQYIEAGAGKVTILDTTPFARKAAASLKIARAPSVLCNGVALLAGLKARGVTIVSGVSGLRIDGEDGRVAGVSFQAGRRPMRLDCDAVAIGHGLRAETQLAELAGAELAYDATFDQWLPRTDADGRAADGLYLAGDGARIGGAAAAELAGRVAAMACLADLGRSIDKAELIRLRTRRDAYHASQEGLAQAFAWPRHAFADLPDETVLCRCENVTAGAVRAVARSLEGVSDINRVKALTRCGMGRCQARMCGLAAVEVAAAARQEAAEALTYYRPQPPVKPIFIPEPALSEV
ncbi:FAD/NAD(P)-dependent oxidoreductase [Chelatococcus asaccharovorans]|uniref:FAD/NAD(P)-dependent oxidoreductase n=1 Tax=Chelatococcus asaccharovorans TaxID=28210 RepID=UPI00224C7967|nr:FAD/NAD(P)-binding oxidoreductase [Chelatococcus asaccharovorans]CAH1650825.1 NADPH-dependent 2,4-dienoyl-CoA reductase/sulfur reductase-like enzyme [Chelatococcus asaccharovorans]CAH1692565.1 NADPH-dependent 2,4-dienoyl-CoA reductase/sulfur reductase-like enzyme [Chelatococcus asaccharovorans]